MNINAGKILVIDDDNDILLTSRVVLKPEFEFIQTENDPFKIPFILRENDFDVILLDMNFSTGKTKGKEGIYWLKEIFKVKPEQNVIMITAYAEINLAIDSMKIGAVDFIIKPWDNEKLIATVSSAVKLSQSKKEVQELRAKQENLKNEIDKSYEKMIGKSEVMQKVQADIEKVAKTDANVLILGENGTGKELVARAIHKHSHRSNQIFVNVDLGALPESLCESELFGHTKGAFTDAKAERSGKFEIANGGSLFLDEIGNISPFMQSKLLSVIEKKEVIKLGSNKAIPVDIRLISATNMPIKEMAEQDEFRKDLLYRINTVEINLPPLRERIEDIPLLIDFFKNQYQKKYKKPDLKFHKETLKKFKRYDWPGNVRELKHIIERAVIMSDSTTIQPGDVSLSFENTDTTKKDELNIDNIEKEAIQKAIQKHKGNLSKASKELGMGRTTLYRKMNKYGI